MTESAWPIWRETELHNLLNRRLSYSIIAERMGLTKSQVRHKALRMGCTAPNPRDDRPIEQFAELMAEGSSIKGAARELGLSEGAGAGLFGRIRREMGGQAV